MRFIFLLFTSLWLLLLSTTNCTSEKPVFSQREFISLEGEWQCDLGKIKLPGTVDESRLAPRNTDTLNTGQLTRLNPYMGKMKYTREIEIPATSAQKEWQLIMERTKPSTVWIDGDSIGTNSLILSSQIYTIGKLREGKHTITIEIDNGPNSVPQGIHGSHAWTDATQTNWNGVIGRFGLEANDGILISDLQVYPDVSSKNIPVVARIKSSVSGAAKITVKGYVWNTNEEATIPEQTINIQLGEGQDIYKFDINTGDRKILWSEFDPALYKVNFEIESQNIKDTYTIDFGIRDFSTKGTQFTINSLKTFLRGKHDACVFPLTGYPPMDKEEWKKQMRISKEYGLNHYRFHSWTPPQAAFDAANEEGIYMQAELPYWGGMDTANVDLNKFLINEGEHVLTAYGNNPSFVMMALGNELGGDVEVMRNMVTDFRKADKRRLYAFGANNMLGTAGQQQGEDFFVTCRVGGQVGSDDFSQHTRATFSFADAKDGGYMNGVYPSTCLNFANATADCTVPVISHENGQFQVYPDYNEIKKYTGVLYPYNMEIFQRRLQENGLQDQAQDFNKATARFAALCYKADIEMCFRTPGFGGFQVLDLQDYPGQGSAYVGILDAFMDNKGGMEAKEFKGFCDEIVPLSVMSKYCWSNNETFAATVKVSNYSKAALSGRNLSWTLHKASDKTNIAKGELSVNVSQGELTEAGKIEVPLRNIGQATQLKLTLQLGSHVNQYDIWVYPDKEVTANPDVNETTSLTEALELLKQGKKVLYIPEHKEIEKLSVGGLFTPDYWNYAMFKNISEWVKRDVSPGTLSILTDPSCPLFKNFPTEAHSNWQWWIISKNSRPFILDKTPKDYKPLVQVVDNIERNHKLGLLYEVQVGEGKLLVSMCNLNAINDKPEGKQFHQSIVDYMASADFAPVTKFTEEEIKILFSTSVAEKKIVGVKNITTYE
ncbi:glycoside hydrolase [Dysgonomonas sp. 521]|uniref:glycoside hydrolase n=1 Tax=Dysgonomonas sp. 521 TaxID=2302932 RepID=UPI0013D36190|nr:glycoside hydrolase [Dysgonomonas sp. 521]NDV95832.1 glycoside hydrolase [Dysgonomonas sp. 521]